MTVQIRDDAHVKPKSLRKATDIAGRMYRRAGVGIEWLTVVSEDAASVHDAARTEATPHPVAQLTIEIVTSAVAKRRGYADDVVGFVSVPPDGGMGRVGYVIYDRIKDVAFGSAASTGDILGIIIAHDIGRLILGAGSGTFSGVMTRLWNREELQRVNPLKLSFTRPEIERLRAALGPDECIASRDTSSSVGP